MKKHKSVFLLLMFLVLPLYSQSASDWVPLESLSSAQVLQTIEKEMQKKDPLFLDDVAIRSQAEQIEKDVGNYIQGKSRGGRRILKIFFQPSPGLMLKSTTRIQFALYQRRACLSE